MDLGQLSQLTGVTVLVWLFSVRFYRRHSLNHSTYVYVLTRRVLDGPTVCRP
jgi:hypothetical protein